MQRVQALLEQKRLMKGIKQTLDKNAPFYSEEGARYAKTLAKLVLIELELEEIEKTALGERP